MPMFKPLTRTVKTEALAETKKEVYQEPPADKITERLVIIFDDSMSMDEAAGSAGKKIALAREATEDYLRHCAPYTTAVEVQSLDDINILLTANLPKVAKEVRELQAIGGTPLYRIFHSVVQRAKQNKYTHITIFTDGAATDSSYFTYHPNLFLEALELGIPIDLILIEDTTEVDLLPCHQEFKNVCEQSKGTFLICKDGKAFRDKMKYFAPTLRYMLPQIASKGN